MVMTIHQSHQIQTLMVRSTINQDPCAHAGSLDVQTHNENKYHSYRLQFAIYDNGMAARLASAK